VTAGWNQCLCTSLAGIDPRTGQPSVALTIFQRGGPGAMRGADGYDALGFTGTPGSMRSPDMEMFELSTPHLMHYCEYLPDSAGAGEWRGGIGTIYRWRVETNGIPAANFGGGVHEVTAPFGLEGGQPAPPHQLRLHKGDKVIAVDAESFYDLDAGDVFEIHQSGGGGYGDPRKRAVASVVADVRDGLVSVERAAADYGVVLNPKTLAVDEARTREKRG
jgi:N-methylhydantoinase B